ncbi:hypothetical protein NIES4071_90340 [Calothrix sp. NIES-4071]|nr:hypothetical protein NIES4071_90340 [Calothrix sp. NIES-4071]BAZ63301.1 hypothetical protein NIES4105_90270 [Calothrix sp. NIES-4105]
MTRLKVTDLSFCRVLSKNDANVKGGLNRIIIPNSFLFSLFLPRLINNNSIVGRQVVTATTLVSTARAGVVLGKNFISSFASATSVSTR